MGLLRSTVAIVDMGSMARASERICLTPSAISMQIKRLEELAGVAIFVRNAKSLQLTAQGEILLDHARKILALNDGLLEKLSDGDQQPVRLGLIQDVADTAFSGALSDIVATSPSASLHVKVAGSAELRTMLDENLLDMIVCLADPPDPDVVCTLPLQWFGDERLLERRSLPLALLDKPCTFRSAAIEALSNAGFDFHVILETPSVAAIGGAVDAGLAITCRTALTGGKAHVLTKLPALPRTNLAIKTRNDRSAMINALSTAMRRSLRAS